MLRTTHWTAVRCWRENGDELEVVERLGVLALLYRDRARDIPSEISFYDPSVPEPWPACLLTAYTRPLRDEIDWCGFPIERLMVSGGGCSADPSGPPADSRREAPNAPRCDRPRDHVARLSERSRPAAVAAGRVAPNRSTERRNR